MTKKKKLKSDSRTLNKKTSAADGGKENRRKEKEGQLLKSPFVLRSFLVLFFIIAGFSLYSKTLNSPFVFDDIDNITENRTIRLTELTPKNILNSATGLSSNRPVSMLTFALNYYFGRYDPEGYHFVNIVIHVLNAILLFFFLTLTFKISRQQNISDSGSNLSTGQWISFFVALIWLVHPIQTQSVTYVVQRMNSIGATFFILALLCYVMGRMNQLRVKQESGSQDTRKQEKTHSSRTYLWFAASIVSGLLALGSKESTATLPFFVFLYEWYFFQDLSPKWFKSSLKYIIAVAIIFGAVAFLYLGTDPLEKLSTLRDFSKGEFTLAERALTQTRVVVYYLSLIFFPHPSRLNLDYDFPLSHSLFNPITTLFSLILIIGLIALAIYLAKRERLISFCILWFFGNLLIESSIIPLAIIFEHRNYLPSMMVCLVPILLAERFVKMDQLKIGLACVVIVVFSIWTYQRNQVWKNEFSLWSDVIKKSPNKARPYYNMGLAFADQSMTDEAIENFSTAIQLDPEYAYAHNNLAVALANQGKIDQAISHFQEAVRIKTDYAKAHNNWGAVLEKQGKLDEAIDHFRQAANIRPDLIDAQFNLGAALAKQGKIDQAIDHYNMALRLDPNRAEVHNNLAAVLVQKGQIEAAIFHFREALRIKPDFPSAQNNLNKALTLQALIEEKNDRIQAELKNRPNDPLQHYEMGNIFLARGDLNKAKSQYQKALTLQPRFLQALNNLALVYAKNKEYANALSEFHKMLDYWPDNAETYYNVACMYSRLNRVDESVEWLKKAINKGYTNWMNIKTDSDLENIRNSLAYQELIRDH